MSTVLSKQQVMQRLNIGRYTFERLVHEDPEFRTLKLGHRRLMTEEALEEYVRRKEGRR